MPTRLIRFAGRAKTASVVLAVLAVGLVFATSYFKLAAQTRQQRAKHLLAQCLEAMGGDAFLNVRNMVQKGRAYSFQRQNLRGLAVMSIYTRFEPMRESDDPDWLPVSRREVYTEKGDYYVLFQNGKGWEVTFRGARPLPEDSLHRYRESTRRDIFYILRYRFNEPGMYFYYAGTEIIDNVPTHAIEIVDGRGEAVTVYLRMSDNLPVQQVYIRRDPKTRIPYEEKSVFSKYRKVGQVTLPWNVQRRRDDSKIFELFGQTVEIDRAPAEMFALKKKLAILPPKPS